MRKLGWAAFAVFAALLAVLFAIGIRSTMSWEDKDPPELAARKEECRKLVRYVIALAPESKGQSADELAAKVPIEDIELCAAAKPEVLDCMGKAADITAVRACIPPPKS